MVRGSLDGHRGGSVDAALDLVAGSTCLGCTAPGRPWCGPCAAALVLRPWCCWPDPVPDGLLPPWAAAPYSGAVREVVLAHKERRVLPLAAPLGGWLAQAVAAALEHGGARPGPDAVPVVLVPVPSRRAGVRARGHDATARMTRAAAADLRQETGSRVVVAPLLRLRTGVLDQSGLDAGARAANLAGSMACDARRLARLAGRTNRARVVVCDDVLTTGATVREAQRALEASGVPVVALAAVAATTLRRRRDRKGSSDLSSDPATH